MLQVEDNSLRNQAQNCDDSLTLWPPLVLIEADLEKGGEGAKIREFEKRNFIILH